MSWYRTHRPQKISELHLPLVRETLDRVRTSGSFSHAYLFTGPKGTGKTSSARILAKMLNCEKNHKAVAAFLKSGKAVVGGFEEPCGECAFCKKIALGNSFNVTEMDAASNRGIDDIRLLRERINLAPIDGPVAVYIIDEVHMLTTEAFNALLKVLEEPPAHVVFVLATTELHKVPDTIISRCTTVMYKKATVDDLRSALESVLKKEKIHADEIVLTTIAQQADGSFRDAIKALESIASGRKTLTKEALLDNQGGVLAQAQELAMAVQNRDIMGVSQIFQAFSSGDVDVLFVQKHVLKLIHEKLVTAVESRNTALTATYSQLLNALNTPIDPLIPVPHLPFEIACMIWCMGGEATQKQVAVPMPTPKTQTLVQHVVVPQKPPRQIEEVVLVHTKVDEPVIIPSKPVEVVNVGEFALDLLVTRWQDILKVLRPANATVEALLRAARPSKIDGKSVTIEVFYPFHKEQLEQVKHRRLLESVIMDVCQVPAVQLVFVLGQKKKIEPASVDPAVQKKDEEMEKDAADAFLS